MGFFLFAVGRLTDEIRQESLWIMIFVDEIVICRAQVEVNIGEKSNESTFKYTKYMHLKERVTGGKVKM